MPPKPSKLPKPPRVAPSTSALEIFAKRPVAISAVFLAGLVLVVIGQFKPLAAHFFAAFPWILTVFGVLLCLSVFAALFDWRELIITSDEKILGFGFGLAFLVVLIFVAIFFPRPSDSQYLVFRVVLALAAAMVAGIIPGIFEIKKLWIRATGAIAVFATVYFFSPAALSKLH